MSDRWVSHGRKFCKFCNCWFADNKISIDNHEKGTTHQANVEKELTRTRQSKLDHATAERLMIAEMHKIEAAALKSFEEDAKRDPFASNEMERMIQARSKLSGSSYHK